jgi:hypothetical protein
VQIRSLLQSLDASVRNVHERHPVDHLFSPWRSTSGSLWNTSGCHGRYGVKEPQKGETIMTRNGAMRVAVGAAIAVLALLLVWQVSRAGERGYGMGMMGGTSGDTDESTVPVMRWMGTHHMAALARLDEVLAEAKEAADAGDAEKAAERIATARQILQDSHRGWHHHFQSIRMGRGMHHRWRDVMGVQCPYCQRTTDLDAMVVNTRCPITGDAIDPDTVPENLTHQFKGRRIGFCCPACPAAWDKLSDEEKQEKLDAVAPESDEE